MRRIIYGGILLLVFIIQSTILVQYRPFGVIPDLLLLVATCGALLRGSLFGIQLGLGAGILQDLVLGNFGIGILAKVFVSYLVGTLEDKVVKEQILVPILVILVTTFAHEILFLFLSEKLIFSIPLFWALKAKILPLAVANAIFIIPIYWFLFWLEKKIYYY